MEVLGVGPHETWMVGDNLDWEIMAPWWAATRAGATGAVQSEQDANIAPARLQ